MEQSPKGALVLLSSVVGLTLVGFWAGFAQTSCPNPPTIQYDSNAHKSHWPKSTSSNPTIVHYCFDQSVTSTGQQQQVQNAINTWQQANKSNGSGVSFAPADSHNSNCNLTFLADNVQALNSEGAEFKTVTSSTGDVQSATVTFHLGAFQLSADGSTASPMWNPGDSAGYAHMFLTVALHEIGHTMGLSDVKVPGTDSTNSQCGSVTKQGSIMNPSCGTNDSNNNRPDKPTPCDQQVLQNQVYGSPTPSTSASGSYWDPSNYYCTYYFADDTYYYWDSEARHYVEDYTTYDFVTRVCNY